MEENQILTLPFPIWGFTNKEDPTAPHYEPVGEEGLGAKKTGERKRIK
jgi:hypothetical protein